MSEWKRVKLKELIKEVNERNKGEKVKRVLSVTNSRGFVSQEEYFEGTVHSANISNYKIVRKNQFAYNPSRVNVGSIDILKDYEEGALSPMYIVFEVDTTKLLPDYFKYYFQTNRFFENVKNNTQGSVRNSLSFKALSDFDYLLPPIEEQEKIVEILKTIDSIIEKHESLLEEKNQFIKSQFVEMFEHNNGICMKTLKMVTSFQQGTQVPIEQQTDEMLEGYKRFLRIIDYTQPPQEARYVNVKGKEVDERSVVVVRYGASSGFVGRGYSGVLANNLFEIHPKNNCISKDFLYYSLKYGSFESVINKKASGAAMPAISFNMIEDIMIPIPDIELQNRFADIVQLIDKQKFLLEKQKQNYENLKKALMQQLLTGKVRVKI